jgi:hypothetical protein
MGRLTVCSQIRTPRTSCLGLLEPATTLCVPSPLPSHYSTVPRLKLVHIKLALSSQPWPAHDYDFISVFLLVHSVSHALMHMQHSSACSAARISRPLGRARNPLLEPSSHAAPQPLTKIDLEWTRLVISCITVSENTVSTRRQCAGLASCGQTCN